jgi:hypothetical protein
MLASFVREETLPKDPFINLGELPFVPASTGLAPFMQKPMAIIDTAFNVFGFLPPDDDIRWPFLAKYTAVKDSLHFGAMNFENAWGRAVYLSDELSWRRGFVTTLHGENTLQLDRALDNLAHRKDVLSRFDATCGDDVDVRFKVTDALITHSDRTNKPETPCPEALYQLRLYVGEYLGRVGFNLHTEDNSSIVSIVNIQGVPDGRSRIAKFEEDHGINPFNFLVKRVVRMAEISKPDLEVRGLINPKRGNSRLYNGVFRSEGIPMYKAYHKPSYTPPQPVDETCDQIVQT